MDKQLQFVDFGNCTDKLLTEGLVQAGEERKHCKPFPDIVLSPTKCGCLKHISRKLTVKYSIHA